MSHNILIIEDDLDIAEGLKLSLADEGFNVEISPNGEDGVIKATQGNFDLIILDIMMPLLNGFEVISELRQKTDSLPIIILSAREAPKDKVRALNLGADDYVTKPFDFAELVARIKRKLAIKHNAEFRFGPWTYSFFTQQLTNENGNKPVKLTTKDQRLLELFINKTNQIVTREEIIAKIWGTHYDGTDRTVDNAIVRLRKVIGNEFIQTIRSQGYRFITD